MSAFDEYFRSLERIEAARKAAEEAQEADDTEK